MRLIRAPLFLFALVTPAVMSASERAFPPTPVDTIEIKTLPASRLLKATAEDADYFAASNRLFGPLFRYISENNIKMTSPVEAEIEPGEMIFYLGSDVSEREFASTNAVEVFTVPPRTVLSLGQRGGYSEERFRAGVEALENWLAQQTDWQAAGPARAIYWHGPSTPGFMRRAEVHIPVVPRIKMDLADQTGGLSRRK